MYDVPLSIVDLASELGSEGSVSLILLQGINGWGTDDLDLE
jgi:hypothetical protein